MLTRGNTTVDLADPTTWYYNTSNRTCVNGTVWNGWGCINRTETFYHFPEAGIAVFVIFPQSDSG